MAVLEQLVFGYRASGEQRRQILGCSPGLVGDCAQEVVRLCEGWGALPSEGLRWPALLSFPLVTRLKSLPGDLHAVIHIAPGVKPIYHAVVLNRADYQGFDLNPFALAQEDVFLSTWNEEMDLPRRELTAGCLAPLVSPPPGKGDLGSVDEAVRQMLANQRLLLPLEQGSRDSDRFLALIIACLPRVLRQDLRFASWTPSGTNRYSLAAVYQESAMFSAWQPYLMTTVLGNLNPSCMEYMSGLQRCLREGDLAGLERHSAANRIELGRATMAGRRKPDVLTATVKADTGRGSGKHSSWSAVPGSFGTKMFDRTRPSAAADGRGLRRRPLRRYRSHEIGRLRRVAAILLSLAILVIGGYVLWVSGIRSLLPENGAADLIMPLVSERGPVDVAALYERLTAPLSMAGQFHEQSLKSDRRKHGLEQLSKAEELLVAQSRHFLREADQTLMGSVPGVSKTRIESRTKTSSEPGPDLAEAGPLKADRVPPQVLLPRGPALARQLRLLVLAQVSLHEHADWRDLAKLEDARVRARFDSLLVRRQARGPLEIPLVDVQRLLWDLENRTRQLEAVHTLEQLMQQERWDPRWDQRCEAAADALLNLPAGRARQVRDDAWLLIRFKRAEHATGVAAKAFAYDHGPWSVQTPAVLDIMPELLARVQPRHPGGAPPALLRATVDFYTMMAWAAEPGVSLARLGEACMELARNRAVSFDPAVYHDHLARLRFRWMAGLVAEGVPVATMPHACFGDGAALEHLAFLDLLTAALDADAWRAQADLMTDPFLIKWALLQAESLDKNPTFD